MPAEDVPAGAVTYAHSDRAVRRRSFVANAGRALELLETYRTRHSAVVTSRLHCYLPVRSIGVAAEFRPRNRSDIRFDGLLDIDDEAFGAIRAGLLGRLEQVHAAILGGRPEAEVYALWRELTAADVSAAEERHEAPAAAPAGGRRGRAAAAGARSAKTVVAATAADRGRALRGRPAQGRRRATCGARGRARRARLAPAAPLGPGASRHRRRRSGSPASCPTPA